MRNLGAVKAILSAIGLLLCLSSGAIAHPLASAVPPAVATHVQPASYYYYGDYGYRRYGYRRYCYRPYRSYYNEYRDYRPRYYSYSYSERPYYYRRYYRPRYYYDD